MNGQASLPLLAAKDADCSIALLMGQVVSGCRWNEAMWAIVHLL